jgi:hypothetical protein
LSELEKMIVEILLLCSVDTRPSRKLLLDNDMKWFCRSVKVPFHIVNVDDEALRQYLLSVDVTTVPRLVLKTDEGDILEIIGRGNILSSLSSLVKP